MVEKEDNHTVIVVDASKEDVEDLGLFCKFSEKNYDVYLYKGETGDLEYLASISNNADQILINDTSSVSVQSQNVLRFGEHGDIHQILDYFNRKEREKILDPETE